jgi:FdhD protein
MSKEISLPEERGISVYLNGRELVTLSASPNDHAALALGFLFTEGLIKGMGALREISVDESGNVWVETRRRISHCGARRKVLTSGCGKGMVFQFKEDGLRRVRKRVLYEAPNLRKLVKEGLKLAEKVKTSRGLHAAFLCDKDDILTLKVDIGRHNAVDKVIGEALRENFLSKAKMLGCTGRLSSEIVLKVLRARIPVLASLSSPTDAAVELARRYGITLVGYVRGQGMLVYAEAWRVVT